MSWSVQYPKSNPPPEVKTFKAVSLRYIQVFGIQIGMDQSFHFLLERQELELRFFFFKCSMKPEKKYSLPALRDSSLKGVYCHYSKNF